MNITCSIQNCVISCSADINRMALSKQQTGTSFNRTSAVQLYCNANLVFTQFFSENMVFNQCFTVCINFAIYQVHCNQSHFSKSLTIFSQIWPNLAFFSYDRHLRLSKSASTNSLNAELNLDKLCCTYNLGVYFYIFGRPFQPKVNFSCD